jgi:isochorismate hydrolase
VIVPASEDVIIISGVVSLVGVVTAVTSAITGAVVSVVVELSVVELSRMSEEVLSFFEHEIVLRIK